MQVTKAIRELTDNELMILYKNMKWTQENCECGADYNVCKGCILTNKLREIANE